MALLQGGDDAQGASLQVELALDGFRRCFRERKLTSDSHLLEIVDEVLTPRLLNSSSEYVRLMAANAAWSAWRAGLLEEATHWLVVATDAESELGEPDDSSISILRRKLQGA